MNIIDINYEKLEEEIIKYTRLQALNSKSYIEYKEPIILMNNETLKFLNQKNEYYIQNESKTKSVPMVFGCYIAIAEWLPFGEVELK